MDVLHTKKQEKLLKSEEQIRKIKDFSLICSRHTKVFDCKEKIWGASDYSIYIIGRYNFPII